MEVVSKYNSIRLTPIKCLAQVEGVFVVCEVVYQLRLPYLAVQILSALLSIFESQNLACDILIAVVALIHRLAMFLLKSL